MTHVPTRLAATSSASANAATSPALQRPCACGAEPAGLDGQCTQCQRTAALGMYARLEVSRRDDRLEHEAERAADQVTRDDQRSTLARASRGRLMTATASPAIHASGSPLDRNTRAFMETRFGHDFGAVRVHTDSTAAASAKALQAHAFTVGQHVVFSHGRYAPHSTAGRRLIAHELAHTVQQRSGPTLIQRDEDEEAKKKFDAERARAKKRLEDWAASKNPAPSTDPTDKNFAFTAQELALEMTHKKGDDAHEVLDKPKDKTKLKAWETAFRDAYHLALMILDATGAEQRTDRASLIAQDLAQAGFITEALDVAKRLPDEDKRFVYESVTRAPESATADQISTVSTFFANTKASPGDHAFLARLTDRSGKYARRLGKTKLLAALEPTLTKYRKDADYVEDLAEVLVFDTASRVSISEWLWTADKEFLFEILNTPYFGEPGYEVDQFQGADGKPRELTLAADLPWVYTYKQKFYTDYLVGLGTKHKIDIKAPANLKFAALRSWLDAETEDIGKALAAEHPDAPEKITEAYQYIADIFFFHVDRGDVTPNLAGKLAHLGPDAPRNMRLKADCDVLATYATRLLRSAGFTPVGYMAIEPDVDDSHAVALLTKALPGEELAEGEAPQPGPDRYYIVNNKQVTPNDAASKEAAIKALRKDALGVYDPEPNAYEVFYEDAAANGAMTRALWTTDESVHRRDLDKVAPPPAP